MASAISLAALPAIVQEDGSDDGLGLMNISLKDVVKRTLCFQGALQGAGSSNDAGLGGCFLLSIDAIREFFTDL